MSEPTRAFRFAVNVTPKPGILDPQGRAVERSLPHLGIAGVGDVRVGRRVELRVEAADQAAARTVVERLARELLSNPLIEAYEIEAREIDPDGTGGGVTGGGVTGSPAAADAAGPGSRAGAAG